MMLKLAPLSQQCIASARHENQITMTQVTPAETRVAEFAPHCLHKRIPGGRNRTIHDPDISTIRPDLCCLLAIPSPRHQVIAGWQLLGEDHTVHKRECPPSALTARKGCGKIILGRVCWDRIPLPLPALRRGEAQRWDGEPRAIGHLHNRGILSKRQVIFLKASLSRLRTCRAETE